MNDSKYGNHNIASSTFCTFQPLAVIPRLPAQWRKTRAPNANGVGTALSYGTVADSPDRIEAWGASTEAAVTWSSYHNWTSTWNNPAVRLHLSPCERRGMQHGNNGDGQRLRWGRQMPYRTHVLPNIRIQAQRRLLIMLAGFDREPDVSAAADRVQRGGCCAATRPLNP